MFRASKERRAEAMWAVLTKSNHMLNVTELVETVNRRSGPNVTTKQAKAWLTEMSRAGRVEWDVYYQPTPSSQPVTAGSSRRR